MNASLHILIESAIHQSFSITYLADKMLNTDLPNRLSYHRILLVQAGDGRLTVDDQTFHVNGEEVFLMAKGQIFSLEGSKGITGYMLSFGDCFWERTPASASNCKAVLFNNAAANQRLALNETEQQELSFLFEALLREQQATAYTNQLDAMAAYLKIIMIKLANVNIIDEGTFDSQDYIVYRQFMELLSKNFRTHHEVSEYAGMLNITSRRLSDLCKRCCDKTAKELISGQIVAEAKRSLQFSSAPVKEIAYQLSFGTPEQFSHFFKKYTNLSPAGYRHYFINQ